jgi:uncharacterized protein involved in type VI secretion and phage assembly
MNPGDLLNSQEQEEQMNKIFGVVIGIVTDNKDEEKLGRVKLSFPWREESDQSQWARVAAFMAGKNRGAFFLPEVGDEVLVAFDRGEIDHPYVICSLWNGKDTPPEKNDDGKNNIRKIRSRSGHEIVFNDDNEKKKEKVQIKTNGGHKVVLDDSAGKEKIEIVDKTGNNKMTIDSVKNSIEIECDMELKIKANKVEIEGTGSLTLKSSGVVTIQGMPVKIN